MKQRTATKSNSRSRGSLATKRSRSLLPAVTRRRKVSGSTRRQKRTGVSAKSKAGAGSRSRASNARGSRTRMQARSAGPRSRSSSRSRAGSRSGGSARMTTDHGEIRQWVESHGGKPATVKSTTRGKDPAGLLRIDFPGYSGRQSLKPISWDQFFKVFDQRKLAFLYQGGNKSSRFNKLVCRTS